LASIGEASKKCRASFLLPFQAGDIMRQIAPRERLHCRTSPFPAASSDLPEPASEASGATIPGAQSPRAAAAMNIATSPAPRHSRRRCTLVKTILPGRHAAHSMLALIHAAIVVANAK